MPLWSKWCGTALYGELKKKLMLFLKLLSSVSCDTFDFLKIV